MRVVFFAVDPSADVIAAHAVRGLHERLKDVEITGVGGSCMMNAGMKPLKSEKMSVIANKICYNHVRTRAISCIISAIMNVRKLARYLAQNPPDILVTADAYYYSIIIAKYLKKHCPKVVLVHMISPSVWVYYRKRADICKRVYDHMIVLYPFELPYFQNAENMTAVCCGCPLLDYTPPDEEATLKKRQEILSGGDADRKILLILSGSRKGVLQSVLSIQKEVIERVAKHNNIKVVNVALPETYEEVVNTVKTWDIDVHVECIPIGDEHINNRLLIYSTADVAYMSVGASALDMMYADVPMVVYVYRSNSIFEQLVIWLCKKTLKSLQDITPSLVGCISSRKDATPFFMTSQLANAYDDMACTLSNIISKNEEGLECIATQKLAFEECKKRLGEVSASHGNIPFAQRVTNSIIEASNRKTDWVD